jgi:glycosyltransferase involved in cell wall biosynthesis
MNIWVFSLFDPTPVDNMRAYRYTGISIAGIKLGHNITLFSSTFRHSTRVQRFEKTTSTRINENYEVVYVKTFPYTKNISIRRLISHWKYAQNVMHYIKDLSPPDIILVALPPLSLSYFLTKWAKKHQVPVVIDIIDPWPDAFLRLAPNLLKSILKLCLFPLYFELKSALRKCSGVIGISNEYISWACNIEHSIEKKEVFLPAVPFREIREKISKFRKTLPEKNPDKLIIIYAGSLGISYDIPVILAVAEILNKKYPGKTGFIIAGTGIYQRLVEEYCIKCSNIKYLGYQYYEDLLFQYASSDLALTQYTNGATQSVTYKFFDCLSAGLPILNSLMTEMARLVEEYQVGYNNPPGNTSELTKNIEKFLFDKALLETYKQNALNLASSRGDSEVVYKELIDFLEFCR